MPEPETKPEDKRPRIAAIFQMSRDAVEATCPKKHSVLASTKGQDLNKDGLLIDAAEVECKWCKAVVVIPEFQAKVFKADA